MQIIAKDTEAFNRIEELLGEHPESTELELVAGIDCDADDIETQREGGDDDPMATIELIAQWNPNTKEGVLDWYCGRESTINDEEPEVEPGGSLLGFSYEGEAPDLDALLDDAIPQLNAAVEWAEFELNEEEE